MRWEVFGRRTWDDPWTAVGAVHAPDREMALLLARDSFFRHGEGVDLAVVRLDDLHVLGDASLLEPSTDKSYRLQSGYTGLGDKRRRAHARAEEAGALVTKRRPPDKRVLAESHRPRGQARAPELVGTVDHAVTEPAPDAVTGA